MKTLCNNNREVDKYLIINIKDSSKIQESCIKRPETCNDPIPTV